MFGRGFESLRLHKIKAHEKLGFYFLGGMRTRKEGSNYLVPACVRGFGTEQTIICEPIKRYSPA
jgi:hypothetical protein